MPHFLEWDLACEALCVPIQACRKFRHRIVLMIDHLLELTLCVARVFRVSAICLLLLTDHLVALRDADASTLSMSHSVHDCKP
jgi:Na+/H+ antiporter NhaB